MEVFDLNKLEAAITIAEELADGKEPENSIISDSIFVINDPDLIRCMYFIKEVLQAVKRNGGKVGPVSQKSQRYPFPLECLENYVYSKDMTITRFLDQLKSLAGDPDIKGPGVKRVTDWLKAKGYLTAETDKYTGKNRTVTTETAGDIGIYMEQRVSSRGESYEAVLYNKNAQEYIVQNMGKILNGEV